MKAKKQFKIAMPALLLVMVLTVCAALSIPVDAAPDVKTYAPVFNSTYYMEKYPDLKAAFGTNEAALFQHFLKYGMAEGRQGSEEFNVLAYKARYADLQAAFGDNLKSYYVHYINCGKAEGRNAKSENAAAPAQTTASQAAAPAAQPETSPELEVVKLVNADRAAQGLGPVSTTPELMAAAKIRAQEIKTTFSHNRPDGSPCFTAMDACKVVYGCAGENIAAGQTSPASVENGWMNSTGHRANILNGSYKHIGVGLFKTNDEYRYYWVQMFTD